MDSLYDVLQAIEDAEPGSVLATIIHVDGSAYLNAGTMMLVREGGRPVGLLSPGCLESDLVERAREVWMRKQSRIAVYDMSTEDDLTWGAGPGCNGAIQVLLEPLDEALHAQMKHLKECLAKGGSVSLLKRISEEGTVIETMVVTEQGQRGGTAVGDLPEALRTALLEDRARVHRKTKSGLHTIAGMDGTFYMQHLVPQPRLVIIGAGVDARPLADIAERCGYAVTVADWREGMCDRTCFPNADVIVAGRSAELVARLRLTPHDHVVLMTHHFQRDKELLHLLLEQELPYVGVLGPRWRTSRLLEGVPLPDHVRSPVGMDIGAVGAAEIAVSILAELIQLRSGRRFFA